MQFHEVASFDDDHGGVSDVDADCVGDDDDDGGDDGDDKDETNSTFPGMVSAI